MFDAASPAIRDGSEGLIQSACHYLEVHLMAACHIFN